APAGSGCWKAAEGATAGWIVRADSDQGARQADDGILGGRPSYLLPRAGDEPCPEGGGRYGSALAEAASPRVLSQPGGDLRAGGRAPRRRRRRRRGGRGPSGWDGPGRTGGVRGRVRTAGGGRRSQRSAGRPPGLLDGAGPPRPP